MNIKCPKCDQSNTVDFWDNNTKEEMGIEEQDHYISAGASTEDHAKVEAVFNCPICNEEVDGVDLVKEGDLKSEVEEVLKSDITTR